MKVSVIFVIAITVQNFRIGFAEIPTDIKKCHSGDGPCIAKATTEVLHKYPKGNEDLGLPNLEPIHLKELVVARTSGNKPLNLNLKFTNLDVYGLSKTNVTKVVGFDKDPRKSKFEFYATTTELTLSGEYEANGRILLLPIVGKGKAEVQLKNFKSGIKVKVITSEENGKQKISISKLKVQSDPESMKIKLENLFNGNKELGNEMNKVINDNWRDVWTELESGINEGYADIVKLLMGDVLKKLNYDELFID